MRKVLALTFIVIGVSFLFLVNVSYARNVAVSNVSLENVDLENATADVQFTLTQDDTFTGTDDNAAKFYDRIWIVVKYAVGEPDEEIGWRHATLTSGGSVIPATDGKGAVCQVGAGQTVKWDYGLDGVNVISQVQVKVYAIEVVYIPRGQFVYNAEGIGGSGSNNFGGGKQVSVSKATDLPNGALSGWPNGYMPFYIAKYEVSQGQYVDFLNMLSRDEALNRFEDGFDYESTVSYIEDNPYGSRYKADTTNRAFAWLSWDDTKAYASWCAMRPITEMEFERAARGGGMVAYSYPWGETEPSEENSLYTPSVHTFPYDTWKYFANYYDNDNNIGGEDGSSEAGLYVSGDISRTKEQTGASPYGVADMAGNLWEQVINCESIVTPENGNGTTIPPSSWPSASSGKGMRGGSWYDQAIKILVSYREFAGWDGNMRYNTIGFRAGRTP